MLVVIVTVALASTTLAVQLIRDGGWTAVPWDLLLYDIPGVLIGGQIGPRLQGKIAPHTMRRAIAVLFVLLATAMASDQDGGASASLLRCRLSTATSPSARAVATCRASSTARCTRRELRGV